MGRASGLNRRLWLRTRRFVFERDGYRCTKCGKAGRLECHHVKPLHLYPEQNPYEPDGCATLCRGCHIMMHRPARATPFTALVNKLLNA